MEAEGSLPHSQASATYLYPGPAQSSPYTHIPRIDTIDSPYDEHLVARNM